LGEAVALLLLLLLLAREVGIGTAGSCGAGCAGRTTIALTAGTSGNLTMTELVLGTTEGLMALKLIQLVRSGGRKGRDVVHATRAVRRHGKRRKVRVGIVRAIKVHAVRGAEVGKVTTAVLVYLVLER
jgi:hypothetical protein